MCNKHSFRFPENRIRNIIRQCVAIKLSVQGTTRPDTGRLKTVYRANDRGLVDLSRRENCRKRRDSNPIHGRARAGRRRFFLYHIYFEPLSVNPVNYYLRFQDNDNISKLDNRPGRQHTRSYEFTYACVCICAL